ncbi:MAG TPA: DEAD/DEAH box helicase, partial [Anaerolineae bacterium]|nr:DEAD/DEAH box helicase [Anaerolineae bacterium]
MNLSGLLQAFDDLPVYGQVRDRLGVAGLDALHLPRSVRPILLAKLFADAGKPLLLLTSRVDAVAVWQAALETWLPPGIDVLRFREPTALPFERAPWRTECRMERLAVLTRLMAGQHPLLPASKKPLLIVTSPRALLQKTLPKRKLLTNLKVIKLGQIIDLTTTLDDWRAAGYAQVSVVERACQFSQRGGIIDIFPAASAFPVRIELFGDEVDTMRYFDPNSQRSVVGDVRQIVIPPAREALPSLAKRVGEVLQVDAPPKEDDLPAWQDDIEPLLAGQVTAHLEYYLPLMYRRPASLLDYLPSDCRLVVDDWSEVQTAVRDLTGRASAVANQLITLPSYFPNPLHAWDELSAQMVQRGVTVLGEIEADPPQPAEDAPLELADLIQPGPRYGGQERPFLTQLQRARELGQRVVVVSRQAARLSELWHDFNKTRGSSTVYETRIRPKQTLLTLPPQQSLEFVQGTLADGFTLEDEQGIARLHVLSDAEIYGWNRPAPRRRRVQRASAPETYFSDIEPGDYVVHIEYGIGRFIKLVARTIGGNRREYLQIEYANGDMLYIPVHHADRLSKWLGADGGKPKLHRVGEKRWTIAKQRAQQAVNELADELLALYAARETIAGHAFAPDGEWQAALEASFPHLETEDQLAAIAAVKADMEKSMPMDRLICGDVGFGKTEVALRATFKAVMDSKQVAILVPTTVLAQQHFKTFSERLHPFPVEVAILSRFQTQTANHDTIQNIKKGRVDVVIGTHRLLSQDVGFKDLGLVIIDEEQRFGVSHKEKLKQLRTEVDVLT